MGDSRDHVLESNLEPSPPSLTVQPLPLKTWTFVELLHLDIPSDTIPGQGGTEGVEGFSNIHSPGWVDKDGLADGWTVCVKGLGQDDGFWLGAVFGIKHRSDVVGISYGVGIPGGAVGVVPGGTEKAAEVVEGRLGGFAHVLVEEIAEV